MSTSHVGPQAHPRHQNHARGAPGAAGLRWSLPNTLRNLIEFNQFHYFFKEFYKYSFCTAFAEITSAHYTLTRQGWSLPGGQRGADSSAKDSRPDLLPASPGINGTQAKFTRTHQSSTEFAGPLGIALKLIDSIDF